MRILVIVSDWLVAQRSCRECHAGTHIEWLSLYLDGSVAMVANARKRNLGVLLELSGRNIEDVGILGLLSIARRENSIN